MMEKYGVANEDLPVTREQIEKIASLSPDNKIVQMPRNRAEAEDMIIDLMSKQEENDVASK